jgi:hypothetical protein
MLAGVIFANFPKEFGERSSDNPDTELGIHSSSFKKIDWPNNGQKDDQKCERGRK